MKTFLIFLLSIGSAFANNTSEEHNTLHDYVKKPVRIEDMELEKAAPHGVTGAKIYKDKNGQQWYIKRAYDANNEQLKHVGALNIESTFSSYISSLLLADLTENTLLEGTTVDIRLIEGNKDLITSKSLSGFITKQSYADQQNVLYQDVDTSLTNITGRELLNGLTTFLAIGDLHGENLGYVIQGETAIATVIDIDHACISIEKTCTYNEANQAFIDHLTTLSPEKLIETLRKGVADLAHGQPLTHTLNDALSIKEADIVKKLQNARRLKLLQELAHSNAYPTLISTESLTQDYPDLADWDGFTSNCDYIDHSNRAQLFLQLNIAEALTEDELLEALRLNKYIIAEDLLLVALTANKNLAHQLNNILAVLSDEELAIIAQQSISEDYRKINAFQIAMKENLHTSAHYLLKTIKNLDQESSLGKTILLYAITNHADPEIITAILEAGANPNVGMSNGIMPLSLALQHQDIALCQLLISFGVDIELPDENGDSLLIKAIKSNDMTMTQTLLSLKANPNSHSTKDQKTPLMIAASKNKLAMISMLLEAGANVNDIDNKGDSALSLATLALNKQIVKLLLDWGANLEGKNNEGNTPLSLAADLDNRPMVKFLLDAGANPHVKNNKGLTPFTLAEEVGASKAMEALEAFIH